MTAERWKQVKEAFVAVIERPSEERSQFLSHEFSGDPELESELRRLIALHESGEGFLDKPVYPKTSAIRKIGGLSRTFEPGDVAAGRFQIVAFKGAGGMGEVYEAYDTQLGEFVALKTIRPDIACDMRVVERFKREVSRARRIASPHVCRVYELFSYRLPESGIDTIFLTMELLRGENLSHRLKKHGPLSTAQALPLITQLCEGLDAAHRAGIVHQDFKTSNVMLVPREDGTLRAVITDFGLARHVAGGQETLDSSSRVREIGGTPAYMAPEQVEGGNVSFAADIYALGVVAYEMISGRQPFEAESPLALAVMRLKEEPRPLRSILPDLDAKWESGILRCLERQPGHRFEQASDFAGWLADTGRDTGRRRIRSLAPAWKRWAIVALLLIAVCIGSYILIHGGAENPKLPGSVAVLPFATVGSPGDEYYGDGLTEELIHALTNVRDLRVIARDSSFRFKGSRLSPAEVGKQIGARYLLTGSVRRSDDRIRIIVSLVNAATGVQLWSQAFDRPHSDVFAIHEDIALSVAEAINGVKSKEQLAGLGFAPAINVEAYDLYLMGRHAFAKKTDVELARALELFNKAAEKAPRSAAIQAGIADAYAVMAERGPIPPDEALSRAKAAATRAIALDNRLADAYVSLGHIVSLQDRDFETAERHFRRALDLNPNLATAHQWYSYMLAKLRRFDESLQHARMAVELNPLANSSNNNLAVVLFYARSQEALLRQCQRMLDLDPNHGFARMLRAWVFAWRGQEQAALHELDSISDRPPDHPLLLRVRTEVSAYLGRRDLAKAALDQLLAKQPHGGIPSTFIGSGYAALGDADRAFQWLDRAYIEKDGLLSLIQIHPTFDWLHGDPRYTALVAQLGFKDRLEPGSIQPRRQAF